MPAAKSAAAPVLLVHGEETMLVRQRARLAFDRWSAEMGGMDHEVIDAGAANSAEALRALARLREALNTLPFFGSGKVIWFQGCSFLGDDRTSTAQAVTETLGEVAAELTAFPWKDVRLIVSAGKVDKRRSFYKCLEKLGTVEELKGLSANDRDWAAQAEELVAGWFRERQKRAEPTALAALVAAVGPNVSQLQSEVEKLCVYTGSKPEIAVTDVEAVAVRNKQARAFALGDALGERSLPRLLRALDEELWAMERGRDRSEIGILYGLISKVRTLLLARELVAEGLLKPDADYARFKGQVERLPADRFPSDRRFNPQAINPYVLYRAAQQSRHYTTPELVAALDRLMQCNLQMMSTGADDAFVLQRALIDICGRPAGAKAV